MTIYLYVPKLSPNTFVPGQRATIAGMWYCKGRFGERIHIDSETKNHFAHTNDSTARKIMRAVRSAKDELARIQDIYVGMGLDPNLHNANYEIQMDYNKTSNEYTLWGYRVPTESQRATKYSGKSFKEICTQYRKDLETKLEGLK